MIGMTFDPLRRGPLVSCGGRVEGGMPPTDKSPPSPQMRWGGATGAALNPVVTERPKRSLIKIDEGHLSLGRPGRVAKGVPGARNKGRTEGGAVLGQRSRPVDGVSWLSERALSKRLHRTP